MKIGQITIESFESISNSYEAFMFYEYREYFGKRFYELVRDIELIQKKLGITKKFRLRQLLSRRRADQ